MSRAVDTSDVILLQATDGAFPNEGNHSLNWFFLCIVKVENLATASKCFKSTLKKKNSDQF